MTQIILILFVVLFFLGCFAQLIIYPFYWIIVYADIVYLSIIAFFVFIFVGFYIVKKYYRLDRTSIVSLIVSGTIFLGYSAYFEAYFYIKKVAEEKYDTTPKRIMINLEKWTDFTVFGDPFIGCTHADIEIKTQRYYWSFEKRDFVKAKDSLMRCY
ncbi:hypothetical protein [Sulfuricurvum sp.]|jgi:hypothetical protein|uniref:hypothetical protein n=1 Tax=Sulfuricurvum sp. TaxID=2025608 RepID=UPI0026225416|nr:hypothetical protein [Sulfuricurvum sp.]MDD2781050.1 hypothetical protein [Sulfuricurvum sp.]